MSKLGDTLTLKKIILLAQVFSWAYRWKKKVKLKNCTEQVWYMIRYDINYFSTKIKVKACIIVICFLDWSYLNGEQELIQMLSDLAEIVFWQVHPQVPSGLVRSNLSTRKLQHFWNLNAVNANIN